MKQGINIYLLNITTFCCDIEQLIRTAKYKHTLKVKADYKSKKTMNKYNSGDVYVHEL